MVGCTATGAVALPGRERGLAASSGAVDALEEGPPPAHDCGAESLVGIAQTLFITPRTVENHFGSVHRKLGVTGRIEPAGALARTA